MKIALALSLFASFATAQNDITNTALKTLVDATLTTSKLRSADRDRLAHMFETCEVTPSAMSRLLDDAVNTATNCTKVVTDKTTDMTFSTKDKERANLCIKDAKALLKTHGGINFLSVPALTSEQKTTLRQCADGTESVYGAALKVLVQRYTPCKIAFEADDLAIFDTIVPADAASNTEIVNQLAVRNVCNTLTAFEEMNVLMVDLATNTVNSFVNGLSVFSSNLSD